MAGASQGALWFLFRDDLLLVRGDGKVPAARSSEELGNGVVFRREIGVLDGRGCWAAEASPEIEDAGWHDAGEFPPLPPKVSIARAMIDDFAARHTGRA